MAAQIGNRILDVALARESRRELLRIESARVNDLRALADIGARTKGDADALRKRFARSEPLSARRERLPPQEWGIGLVFDDDSGRGDRRRLRDR